MGAEPAETSARALRATRPAPASIRPFSYSALNFNFTQNTKYSVVAQIMTLSLILLNYSVMLLNFLNIRYSDPTVMGRLIFFGTSKNY